MKMIRSKIFITKKVESKKDQMAELQIMNSIIVKDGVSEIL